MWAFGAPASRLWHMVAGTALPFYRFAEPSTSERRLGTVSARIALRVLLEVEAATNVSIEP